MKMRASIVIPFLLALAGCSDDGGAGKAVEAAAPAALPAGQWQASWQVTAMRSTDNNIPAVRAKVGDKEEGAGCVQPAATDRPDPALFSGPGYQCMYQSSYIKDGMLTAALTCTRKGVTGKMGMNLQGSYTANSFEGVVDTTSFLPGPGDFAMSRKVSGRRVGPSCAPAPDAGGKNGG
jgi:hypothetical protein